MPPQQSLALSGPAPLLLLLRVGPCCPGCPSSGVADCPKAVQLAADATGPAWWANYDVSCGGFYQTNQPFAKPSLSHIPDGSSYESVRVKACEQACAGSPACAYFDYQPAIGNRAAKCRLYAQCDETNVATPPPDGPPATRRPVAFRYDRCSPSMCSGRFGGDRGLFFFNSFLQKHVPSNCRRLARNRRRLAHNRRQSAHNRRGLAPVGRRWARLQVHYALCLCLRIELTTGRSRFVAFEPTLVVYVMPASLHPAETPCVGLGWVGCVSTHQIGFPGALSVAQTEKLTHQGVAGHPALDPGLQSTTDPVQDRRRGACYTCTRDHANPWSRLGALHKAVTAVSALTHQQLRQRGGRGALGGDVCCNGPPPTPLTTFHPPPPLPLSGRYLLRCLRTTKDFLGCCRRRCIWAKGVLWHPPKLSAVPGRVGGGGLACVSLSHCIAVFVYDIHFSIDSPYQKTPKSSIASLEIHFLRLLWINRALLTRLGSLRLQKWDFLRVKN